jgi:large subunit ribosomal protein L13
MKTIVVKSPNIKREWYILDAEGKPIGRIAAKVSRILMGKHKTDYTPHLDTGDNVLIINAEKAILTGRKSKNKVYYHYSGYVGGMNDTSYADMMRKKPLFPLEKAIKGMLPKNNLAKKMALKLHLVKGPTHKLKVKDFKTLEI